VCIAAGVLQQRGARTTPLFGVPIVCGLLSMIATPVDASPFEIKLLTPSSGGGWWPSRPPKSGAPGHFVSAVPQPYFVPQRLRTRAPEEQREAAEDQDTTKDKKIGLTESPRASTRSVDTSRGLLPWSSLTERSTPSSGVANLNLGNGNYLTVPAELGRLLQALATPLLQQDRSAPPTRGGDEHSLTQSGNTDADQNSVTSPDVGLELPFLPQLSSDIVSFPEAAQATSAESLAQTLVHASEPVTLLLMGTGLAVIAIRAARHRRH
jgi:hypothetical protein